MLTKFLMQESGTQHFMLYMNKTRVTIRVRGNINERTSTLASSAGLSIWVLACEWVLKKTPDSSGEMPAEEATSTPSLVTEHVVYSVLDDVSK